MFFIIIHRIMALTASNEGSKNFTYIRVGGLTKSDFRPHFHKVVKGDDGLYTNEWEFKAVSGFITDKITFKTIGEENPRRVFEITLTDGEETLKLQCGFNGIWSSLLNSIAGTPNLGKVEISLWVKDGKYAQIGVKNNGERTNWALSIEEQNALKEVITNKKGEWISTDSSELEAKLEKLIEEKFNATLEAVTQKRIDDEEYF